jgi:hypothetical protein
VSGVDALKAAISVVIEGSDPVDRVRALLQLAAADDALNPVEKYKAQQLLVSFSTRQQRLYTLRSR